MESTKLGAALKDRLAENHMPKKIDGKPVQSARHPIRPLPIRITRFPAWYWFYFTLGCALLNLSAWTATPVTLAMQWETLPISSSQAVRGNHCNLKLCRLCIPRFQAPAGPNTAVAQWVWNHSMETESPDTEPAPLKCTVIPGIHRSKITVSQQFSLLANGIISRLYLQKKSLLC